MSFDVKNKTVLVTGANRGIGLAIVREALQRGAAKVYAAVRNTDSAKVLVNELGDRVVALQFDLDDPASILAASRTANDVELVINNAGILRTASPLSEQAIDSLQQEINTNVFGLIRVAQAFAPILKTNGGGALVQLNSVASLKSFPMFATYAASKAASYSLTQALREMLVEQGTQVISVHPGPIATDMGKEAGFDEIAESPAIVASAIFHALINEQFHVWPDSMAQQIGSSYQSFADQVVEAQVAENPV